VDRVAAANADPPGGGELDELQDQIPREVFSRLGQACSGGGVPYATTG